MPPCSFLDSNCCLHESIAQIFREPQWSYLLRRHVGTLKFCPTSDQHFNNFNEPTPPSLLSSYLSNSWTRTSLCLKKQTHNKNIIFYLIISKCVVVDTLKSEFFSPYHIIRIAVLSDELLHALHWLFQVRQLLAVPLTPYLLRQNIDGGQDAMCLSGHRRAQTGLSTFGSNCTVFWRKWCNKMVTFWWLISYSVHGAKSTWGSSEWLNNKNSTKQSTRKMTTLHLTQTTTTVKKSTRVPQQQTKYCTVNKQCI